MLENAISMWPENKWYTYKRFFYLSYHCLIFLDYYLSIPPKDFSSSLPFTLGDYDHLPQDAVDDVIPDKIYSKKELLDYLVSNREKCRNVLKELTEEKLKQPWITGTGKMNLELSGADALHYSVLDILLYNMKHVQHHAAQLNLLLRQTINDAPDYVSMAKDDL
jgi:hypothetical protein